MTKKEKIIHAALSLFAKHGYTETSISKIAKVAGVSKGLTYTHFKNKEDLLKSVVIETIGEMTQGLMDLEELSIKKLLQVYFQLLKSQKDLIRLCLLLVVHPETPQMVKDMLGSQQVELLQVFTHLLKDLRGGNDDLEARILLATLDGITLEYITTGNEDLLNRMEVYLIDKYTK
jgi:AcrR family transcriptional regulator